MDRVFDQLFLLGVLVQGRGRARETGNGNRESEYRAATLKFF